MSYIFQTVTSTGDEKTFFQTFVNALTAADSRITCNADIEREIGYSDVYISIAFGVADTLTFERNNYDTNHTYNIYSSRSGSQISSLRYSYYSYGKSDERQRSWSFEIISNDDMMFVFLYDYDGVKRKMGIGLALGDTKGSGYKADSNLPASLMTANYSFDGGIRANYTNMLNYGYSDVNPAMMQIIKGKSLISDGMYKLTINGLYDCSTVPYPAKITIGNRNYYSIDAHTMIEI